MAVITPIEVPVNFPVLKCSTCVDIAIKNDRDSLDGAENVREAVSWFPVLSVAQTSAGMVANFLAIPLCFEHRKLEQKQSKTGLVTA